MKMKKLITLSLFFLFTLSSHAEKLEISENNTNDSEGNIKNSSSSFSLSLDIQTKYTWRGMEMMTEKAAPVLFPSIGYTYNGLYAYAMGGYSINGQYAEVDLGISYSYKWITIGINDYYYPTIDSLDDNYFTFNSNKTGHWWEGVVTITPEMIPFKLTLSNFFAGADKNLNGKQAYSTYAEIGSWYDFVNNNQIALNIGFALNKSCYNGYEHGFGVCNIEAKYTHSIEFKNNWTLPLSVSYIINPIHEKSFVNFTANFAF